MIWLSITSRLRSRPTSRSLGPKGAVPSSCPPLSRASAIDPRSAPGACVPGPGFSKKRVPRSQSLRDCVPAPHSGLRRRHRRWQRAARRDVPRQSGRPSPSLSWRVPDQRCAFRDHVSHVTLRVCICMWGWGGGRGVGRGDLCRLCRSAHLSGRVSHCGHCVCMSVLHGPFFLSGRRLPAAPAPAAAVPLSPH